MSESATIPVRAARRQLNLARVLLVHGELTSRLALQTILAAAGYSVDVAASPSEAFAKLDEGPYSLVLSGTELGSSSLGRDVLSYARIKEYRPATALVKASEDPEPHRQGRSRDRFSIYTENVPTFLGEVAELIGLRASRRSRVLRHAV
jgi:CheY-like chemotaxis protein